MTSLLATACCLRALPLISLRKYCAPWKPISRRQALDRNRRMPITLGELAERFGCELTGDPEVTIDRVGSLQNAGSNALSFLSGSAFKRQLSSTKAAAVILRACDAGDCPTSALINDNPYACYARMAAYISPAPVYAPGVHPSAFVASTATVASSAHIAANAVVEDGATIGREYLHRIVLGGGDGLCRRR